MFEKTQKYWAVLNWSSKRLEMDEDRNDRIKVWSDREQAVKYIAHTEDLACYCEVFEVPTEQLIDYETFTPG